MMPMVVISIPLLVMWVSLMSVSVLIIQLLFSFLRLGFLDSVTMLIGVLVKIMAVVFVVGPFAMMSVVVCLKLSLAHVWVLDLVVSEFPLILLLFVLRFLGLPDPFLLVLDQHGIRSSCSWHIGRDRGGRRGDFLWLLGDCFSSLRCRLLLLGC